MDGPKPDPEIVKQLKEHLREERARQLTVQSLEEYTADYLRDHPPRRTPRGLGSAIVMTAAALAIGTAGALWLKSYNTQTTTPHNHRPAVVSTTATPLPEYRDVILAKKGALFHRMTCLDDCFTQSREGFKHIFSNIDRDYKITNTTSDDVYSWDVVVPPGSRADSIEPTHFSFFKDEAPGIRSHPVKSGHAVLQALVDHVAHFDSRLMQVLGDGPYNGAPVLLKELATDTDRIGFFAGDYGIDLTAMKPGETKRFLHDGMTIYTYDLKQSQSTLPPVTITPTIPTGREVLAEAYTPSATPTIAVSTPWPTYTAMFDVGRTLTRTPTRTPTATWTPTNTPTAAPILATPTVTVQTTDDRPEGYITGFVKSPQSSSTQSTREAARQTVALDATTQTGIDWLTLEEDLGTVKKINAGAEDNVTGWFELDQYADGAVVAVKGKNLWEHKESAHGLSFLVDGEKYVVPLDNDNIAVVPEQLMDDLRGNKVWTQVVEVYSDTNQPALMSNPEYHPSEGGFPWAEFRFGGHLNFDARDQMSGTIDKDTQYLGDIARTAGILPIISDAENAESGPLATLPHVEVVPVVEGRTDIAEEVRELARVAEPDTSIVFPETQPWQMVYELVMGDRGAWQPARIRGDADALYSLFHAQAMGEFD